MKKLSDDILLTEGQNELNVQMMPIAPPPEPSAYLRQLQANLAELRSEIETWGESSDAWWMIPVYGLRPGVTWGTYDFIKGLMIGEAIKIGLISSAGEVYFEQDHMYYTDGTLIV
ncbi:hypothetical protein ES703_77617 [subsurface metagenome]